MGYLHAVPKEWEDCRWNGHVKITGKEPSLPHCGSAIYLLNHFNTAGRCLYSGFGPTPFTWMEIEAFAEATGYIRESFEKVTLMEMSRAYVAGLSLGEVVNAKAPWHDPEFKLFAEPKQKNG